MVSVVALATAPWDEIAVHYYRKRGLPGLTRLRRVAAVRAGADVAEVEYPIRPGVGVVGVAFASQEYIGIAWRDFVRAAVNEGRAAWDSHAQDDRYGLSWGQLQASPRPEGMIASPTFAPISGKPNGCIVLSGTIKLPDLDNVELRQALDGCATVLDRVGRPPKGWWSAHG